MELMQSIEYGGSVRSCSLSSGVGGGGSGNAGGSGTGTGLSTSLSVPAMQHVQKSGEGRKSRERTIMLASGDDNKTLHFEFRYFSNYHAPLPTLTTRPAKHSQILLGAPQQRPSTTRTSLTAIILREMIRSTDRTMSGKGRGWEREREG
jgi:hypothetical protein